MPDGSHTTVTAIKLHISLGLGCDSSAGGERGLIGGNDFIGLKILHNFKQIFLQFNHEEGDVKFQI
jgi:hypothetical protein